MRLGKKQIHIVRCRGITKKGKQCENQGRFKTGYCPIHADQARKRRFGNYPVVAGTAASTIVVVKEIIEILGPLLGYIGTGDDIRAIAYGRLEQGDFQGLAKDFLHYKGQAPVKKGNELSRKISRYQRLYVEFDKIDEDSRQSLGKEMIAYLSK